ncbi:hypothetical protein CBL_02915 [Carabus blaptoides fortunei]
MNNLNPPPSLNIHDNISENWAFFKQKMNIFLVAAQKSDKTEDVKVTLFLNLIGDDALRFKFFKKTQEPGEFFDQFHTRLKSLANNCDFGTQESSLIRDKIILGVNDCTIQEKLLRDADLQLKM